MFIDLFDFGIKLKPLHPTAKIKYLHYLEILQHIRYTYWYIVLFK